MDCRELSSGFESILGRARPAWAPRIPTSQPSVFSVDSPDLRLEPTAVSSRPNDQPMHSVTPFPVIRTNADLRGWASSNSIEDPIPIALPCQTKIVIGLQPKPSFR